MRLAILGVWEGQSAWEDYLFRQCVKILTEEFSIDDSLEFLVKPSLDMVNLLPGLPEDLSFRVHRFQNSIFCQRCDVVLFLNDGEWDTYKEAMLDYLSNKRPTILWTPDYLSEDLPDQPGLSPSLLLGKGPMDRLAGVISLLFLSMTFRTKSNS